MDKKAHLAPLVADGGAVGHLRPVSRIAATTGTSVSEKYPDCTGFGQIQTYFGFGCPEIGWVRGFPENRQIR